MNDQELTEYFSKDLGWGWCYQSQRVFKFLSDAAAHAKNGVLLDAGAGHQRYAPFFKECIYLAQEHPIAGAENKGITAYDILSDVRCIPLKDNSVNVVLSTSSLEHMEFPQEFFEESFRVLKPGGGLFINVPFIYGEHEKPFDFQRLTSFGLRRWYEAAGFERAEIDPSSNTLASATHWMKVAMEEQLASSPIALKAKLRQGEFLQLAPAITLRVLLRLNRAWCNLLLKIYGDAPHKHTTAPIGWCAVAYKPGTLANSDTKPSKEAFLSANRI